MSLLTIISGATGMLGLPTLDTVVGNDDPTAVEFLALAQEEGRSLAGRCDWQNLTTEHTFTTVAADAQTSSIPSDFDRIIPETMFNRTRNRSIVGPLSQAAWQAYKASLVTHVDPLFRIRGGTILIAPTPTAGQTVAYEYISTKWCQTSASVAQTAWAADTDTAKLSEEAMRLGVIWRWRRNKGLDYSGAKDDYERYVIDLELRDGGNKPRLQTGMANSDRIPMAPQVPETLVF